MTLAQHINKSNKSIKLPVLSFHTDNNSLIFFSKGRDYTRPALLCNTQMDIYVKVIAYFRFMDKEKTFDCRVITKLHFATTISHLVC